MWLENHPVWFQFCFIRWGFYGLAYHPSWHIFHGHLNVLLSGDVFRKRPSGPDGCPLSNPTSLPIFGLVFQSVIIRTVLKSPAVTVVCLFLFPVSSDLGSHILRLCCLVHVHVESLSFGWIALLCDVTLWLVIFFALMSALPDDHTTRHTCFCLIVSMIYFFSILLLSVCPCYCIWSEFLIDKHIVGSFFLIHSANLCLLIGILRSFIFNVIDMLGPKSIILFFIFCLFSFSFLWFFSDLQCVFKRIFLNSIFICSNFGHISFAFLAFLMVV